MPQLEISNKIKITWTLVWVFVAISVLYIGGVFALFFGIPSIQAQLVGKNLFLIIMFGVIPLVVLTILLIIVNAQDYTGLAVSKVMEAVVPVASKMGSNSPFGGGGWASSQGGTNNYGGTELGGMGYGGM